MHVRSRSANLPKLAALLQKAHAHSGFKHMERFPHSSHAVRCYKCCLGLPLAFCAAFRCSLRWRFTTRLFVHVFLPFGFFDKLQKHRPVHSHWAVFFCCETVKPFHSVFFFPGRLHAGTYRVRTEWSPCGGQFPFPAAIPPLSHLIVLLRDSCHPPPRFGMGAAGR